MSTYTRRQLLVTAAAGAAASAAEGGPPKKPELCLFSKHLPVEAPYPETAKAVRGLGIPGVDLTVRPKGHVLPENAARDLPKAFEAFQAEGVSVPMISTGLVSLADEAARPTIYTAGKLGIPFFKLGYYRYRGDDLANLDAKLAAVKRDVEALAGLAQHAGVTGGFHNHSGPYIGSALWDHWTILRDADPRSMGFYFDPCHATIEGGKSGWEIGLHRLADRIKMVACKDFFWEKVQGKWQATMCPLGEGMVDYPKFFALLAKSGFTGPISLHVEYEIDGPTAAARHEKTLEAAGKDFAYLKQQYSAAFG